MANYDEDDLFKHTSMTFGEHLEELRSALFKAVIALGLGFAVSLFFGTTIVGWIQKPLHDALSRFYQDDAMKYVNARVPPEMQDNPVIQQLVYAEGLLPEERFISPVQMLDGLRKEFPKNFEGVTLPVDKGVIDKALAEHDTSDEEAKKQIAEAARLYSKQNMLRLFVWRPLADDERLKLDTLSVQEPFVIYMKASFVSGAVLSSPFVFYFLWSFVAAGLFPHEKRYIHLFLPVSLGLFLCGAALAFFLVFPPVLGFFFGIADSLGTQMRPRLSEWLSFVLLLPLGFGISFQLPLVMLFLDRINVFNTQVYLAKWRIAVLLMAIAAMVLSPGGDPQSMVMMLVPLIGLYFAGIALCSWLPSPKSRATEIKPNPKS